MVESRDCATLETLLVEERELVAAAAPQRIRDFATGRWCAHKALEQHGIESCALLSDANRAPLWPSGIVGSITHADGYCAAAVGRRKDFVGIGIDAESIGRVQRELWREIFTGEEIAWLEQLAEPGQACMATMLFSAKESFYKAQYPFTKLWLEFKAVAVHIHSDGWLLRVVEPPRATPNAFSRLQRPLLGRFTISGPHIMTAIAIDACDAGSMAP